MASKITKNLQLPIRIIAPVIFALVLLIISGLAITQETQVQFSYGDKTCVNQLSYLPGAIDVGDANSDFDIQTDNYIKFGKIRLFSMRTCFSARKAPSVGSVRQNTVLFSGLFTSKIYKIDVPEPPTLALSPLSEPISTQKPLKIELSDEDKVFGYQLQINDKTTDCPSKGSAIYCNVSSLGLAQGENYAIKLIRSFNKQIFATLINKSITTLAPTAVVGSSISQGQIVYDKPKIFTFDFDKDILKAAVKLEKNSNGQSATIETQATVNGKRISLSTQNDLDRESSYLFTIDNLEAKDGSTLLEPYELNFSVSGGPSVTSVNVGSYGVSQTKTIVLTFDQQLSNSQSATSFVSVSGVSAAISRSGNQVMISYNNAPFCSDIAIRVNSGLKSIYDIAQTGSWSYSTRTICHTVSTIGYSKEGRSILAYYFGSGSQTVLYTGAIHGNEFSTKYLMEAWINELEINARSIPSTRRIVVVPSINPDGIAYGRRYNSGGIDLNRNFQTDDWQSDIYSITNQPLPGGGGVSAMSEPETQAIAALTISLQPRLTMSFHSSASYAIGNQYGDSAALANTYSRLTGYRNMTGVSGAFSYPITGTYDDWIRERCGLTSVLIELSSSTNSEFSRNRTALWTMAKL